jgi:hypothetical protein
MKYNMFSSKNGIIWVGDEVYFAGKSYGFETTRQKLKKPITGSTTMDYDAYVYKYKFGFPNKCLRVTEPDTKTMSRNMVYTSGSEVDKKGLYTFSTDFKAVPMTL